MPVAANWDGLIVGIELMHQQPQGGLIDRPTPHGDLLNRRIS